MPSPAVTTAIFKIKPPLDRDTETVVPYYSHAAGIFERVQGSAPTRYSLYKYLAELPGFPVKRGGPYVKVPHFIRRKRVFTTVEAFDRFIRLVAELEREMGFADVDLAALAPHHRTG